MSGTQGHGHTAGVFLGLWYSYFTYRVHSTKQTLRVRVLHNFLTPKGLEKTLA